MAKSYYSTIFDYSADRVWSVVRDFGNYTLWIDGVDDVQIEQGKPGDAVGAIRCVRTRDMQVRQRLLAHSDRDRFYTYEACEPYRFPVRDFVATIRVTPVTEGNRAFVEWWATFDCVLEERNHWTAHFAALFAHWLESLRRHVVN